MTKERKNLLTGALVIIIVYIATLWQRPMFATDEFTFAVKSIANTSDLAATFNGIAGKLLKFNIVSVRLLPALSAIICGCCVRHIGRKEYGEGFGNLCAVIYLSTLLVFAYGTACTREMINAMLLCTTLTCAFSAFELAPGVPGYLRYFLAAAGGGCAGLFAASLGADALFLPFIIIAFYVIFARPAYSRSIVVTGVLAILPVIFIWLLDHRMLLFSRYVPLKAFHLVWLLAGSLPWILFLPQAAAGVLRNKREFFRKKAVLFSTAAIAAGILVFPIAGILPAAVMISPFTAILFACALKEAQNDEKFLKISGYTLNAVLILLLVFVTAAVIVCCVPAVPKSWKIYSSKTELAGFAVAFAVAAIQFKIAVMESSANKVKKLLHTATGMAVLMILLPGVIPQSMLTDRAPEEFYRRSAGRYIAPDTVIYADYNSFFAAKWVFRKHRIIRITKKSARQLAERIEKGKNTAVFSTNRRFTALLPKSRKILFSRGKWRIVLCRSKEEIND